MKLKPVLLAIVSAGLVGPAFAAYGHSQRAPSSACGMPVTGISHAQELMNGNGVYSDARSRVCWHDSVRFSGFADAGYSHAKDNNSTTKGIDLWSAGLIMDAKINPKWRVKVVGEYGWMGDGAVYQSLISYATGRDNRDFDTSKTFHMDEALVTYSDASHTPLYFKIGKGYVNFGRYGDPYAVFPTLTQSMSQLNESYIEFGMMSGQGWYASVTGWNYDEISAARRHQGAVKVGFDQRRVMSSGVGLSGEVSYITNIETVVNKSPYYRGKVAEGDVSGLLAHIKADLGHGLGIGVNYLRVSDHLTTPDLELEFPTHDSGVQIWGANIAYKIRAGGYAHELSLDYEGANENQFLHHWSVGYNVGFAPNVKGYAQYVQFSENSSHVDNPVNAKGWLVGLKGSF